MDDYTLTEKIKRHPRLPRHIGIIMDGNGRWAKDNGLPRVAGHNEGVNSVEEIVEACGQLQIEVLTIYTFSEENWKRPYREVVSLMQLLVKTINAKIKRLMEQNVRIRTLGHLERLPLYTRRAMEKAVERTRTNRGLILNLALSYGGRQELADAFKHLAERVKAGKLQPNDINPQLISEELNTAGMPDPDLVIRTGGEFRISNFLIWQIAYAELYVTQTTWPAFRKNHFLSALYDYVNRERRFGRVSEQLNGEEPHLALQNA